ncbi:MAG: UDP-N-acetylmuramoyl-tripeptide--D-alanyl-D-alanine ligase [Bacteroidaceae bacterium]|nr:UDP-N-acetylmuramoyl-tripeptide--D-alanyl-D-alanine ligase [Bacteroidaceae bacterium]
MDISQLYDLYLQHPIVTTDTRKCPEGSMFFALKGANFDGNRFALDALSKGCAVAVVDDAEVAAQDVRCVLVDDVLTALQALAHHHRVALNTLVVQITGTNGKTTTKELMAAVMSTRMNVLYTEGNLNNHIGVPLTLLRLKPEHEFAIVETGANHIGEIELLSQIVAPSCGIITNIGRAHLEGFGSYDGVIKAKTELYEYIGRANAQLAASDRAEQEVPSFLFCNGDDALLVAKAEGIPTVTYGSADKGYNIEGELLDCAPFLRFRWRKGWEKKWHTVQTQLIGSYNLPNALAAIALGITFKVPAKDINSALENYAPNNSRSEFRRTERNRLVVDAYNANPSSMKAALENFALIDDAHKMLILGEMRELGENSAAAHREVITLAAQTGAQEVWLVGREFATCGAELPPHMRQLDDIEAAKAAIAAQQPCDRLILIKGSNGTKLFQLPELL